jgi:hypothetical protein
LELAIADGSGPNDERAIGHGFCDGLELLRVCENLGGADCGARFAKCSFVGVHDSQMSDAEVAHGAGSRSDVEGIARGDEDDAEAVELSSG